MKKPKTILLSVAVTFVMLGSAFYAMPLPGTIPVLMYHFIGTDQDAQREANFVSRESFSRQMKFLTFLGYRVLSLDQYYEIKTGKRKPRGKEVVITFDDGHESFEKTAFPILKSHSFPATAFVISQSVKSGTGMTADSLKELYGTGLLTIGSHSKTHPFLSELPIAEIRSELVDSKRELEKMLSGVNLFFSWN